MRAQGKPAALVAITAALTLITGTLFAQHHSSPQARPQTVEAASASTISVADEMREIRSAQQRASRSRPVVSAKPTGAPQLKQNKLPKPVVKAHPRSTRAPKPRVIANRHASVSRGTSAYAWAHTTDAIKVANCESGDRSSWDHYNGNPHMRGKYSGKWQMDSDFWSTYGGRQFASTPADASESEQDIVAYKGYLARGWQPWSCARIMGVR